MTSPVSPIRVEPYSFNVQYSEYKHDVLTFGAPKGSTATSTPFVTGLPIRAQWRVGSASQGVFHGYIDRVESQYKRIGAVLEQREFQARCLGVTYPLKSESYMTYTDKTADVVLNQIAKTFQLASIIEPHDVVWPSLAQSGQSWWSFFIDVAKRVGYTVYIRDATLYALDRRMAVGHLLPFRYNLARRPEGLWDALYFEPCASSGSGVDDEAPGSFIVRGKSIFSGGEFEQQSDDRTYTGNARAYAPQFQRVLTEIPRTLAEAQTYLDAAVGRSLFTQRANMSVLGNVALNVGSIIDLSSPHDSIHSGLWFVTHAEHRIVTDRYTTHVEMGKDASGRPLPYPPQPSFSLNPSKSPEVVFRNNMWTAAWSTS